MNRPTTLLSCLFIFLSIFGFAQNRPASKAGKNAYVSGKVIDENENPLQNVSVIILDKQTGIAEHNGEGFFSWYF